MTRFPRFAAALLATALAGPIWSGQALASPCGDQIASLEGRVKNEARDAISANTAGQAGAGARGGQGVTGTEKGTADAPPAAPEKSAEAGKGGDKAMQAKVALDEARTADKKGDAKGCQEAVERAQQQLAAAP